MTLAETQQSMRRVLECYLQSCKIYWVHTNFIYHHMLKVIQKKLLCIQKLPFVIVIFRVLQCPQKPSHGKQLIHRRLDEENWHAGFRINTWSTFKLVRWQMVFRVETRVREVKGRVAIGIRFRWKPLFSVLSSRPVRREQEERFQWTNRMSVHSGLVVSILDCEPEVRVQIPDRAEAVSRFLLHLHP